MENIIKITNPKDLIDIIKTNHRLNISTLILGGIGIGKSDIVRQAHKEIFGDDNLELMEDIRLSLYDRTDFKGLFEIDNGATIFRAPTNLKRFIGKDKKGTIFLDEFNLANEDILSAMYQLCLDRSINGEKVGNEVNIVLAGNTSDEVPNVRQVSPALHERLSIVIYKPNPKHIVGYLKNKYKSDLSNMICGFLSLHEDMLIERIDPDNDSEFHKFGRPRGWERVLRLLNDKKIEEYINNSEDNGMNIYNKMVCSYVGINAATKLYNFIKDSTILNPENYMNKPEQIKEMLDTRKYALLLNVIRITNHEIKNKSNLKDKAEVVKKYYEGIVKHMLLDYVAAYLSEIIRSHDNGTEIVKETCVLNNDIYDKVQKILS